MGAVGVPSEGGEGVSRDVLVMIMIVTAGGLTGWWP